ncbi:hypothetical protein ACTA71_012401 [Dictyostelium dimigraforme]
MQEPIERIRIIICLDGGGTKGYYTVKLLEELSKKIKHDIKKKLSLVGGTSTGGLLAISMGLGDFTYETLGTLYKGEEVKDLFKFSVWKNFIPNIIKNAEFLVACKNQDLTPGEAALATSGIPIVFHQVSVDGIDLFDGGFANNNPIALAYEEARNQFPNDTLLFLSFGTASGGKEVQDQDYLNNINNQSIISLKAYIEELKLRHVQTNWSNPCFFKGFSNTFKWFKKAYDTNYYKKQIIPSQTIYDEFVKELDDEKAYCFRFETKLDKEIKFYDVTDESFNNLEKAASELSKTKQFNDFSELLKDIIEIDLIVTN